MQLNILIRMILSLIIAVAMNNTFIHFVFKVGNGMETEWLVNIFPYFITPFFTVIFISTFLLLTKRIVKDLKILERGLQLITEGDLNYRVPVNRQDELGRVAVNINLMTERLQQQIEKEREVEQSKMEMITGISHDLRTPLTSIIGYIELLRVQNTYNKAFHLKKLLDDLFEYTRLTSVDSRLNLRRVDLAQLLNQLLFEFEPLAEENKVYLIKDIPVNPVVTFIDSEKIARAIDNLLMNALKYSYTQGSIHVRLIADAEYSMIEIENKGTPLSEEQVDRLFERFYKVDYSRKSEGIQTGAGLGLSIARNIAELHRGALTLRHIRDVFTFQLRLPM
ncbi:two-component sensor histidine kinase [Paenibacillus sp. FSL H8-0259]|nr:two-component sensor histidine kinase [Paenibacillus sp. FSL H8-0259]